MSAKNCKGDSRASERRKSAPPAARSESPKVKKVPDRGRRGKATKVPNGSEQHKDVPRTRTGRGKEIIEDVEEEDTTTDETKEEMKLDVSCVSDRTKTSLRGKGQKVDSMETQDNIQSEDVPGSSKTAWVRGRRGKKDTKTESHESAKNTETTVTKGKGGQKKETESQLQAESEDGTLICDTTATRGRRGHNKNSKTEAQVKIQDSVESTEVATARVRRGRVKDTKGETKEKIKSEPKVHLEEVFASNAISDNTKGRTGKAGGGKKRKGVEDETPEVPASKRIRRGTSQAANPVKTVTKSQLHRMAAARSETQGKEDEDASVDSKKSEPDIGSKKKKGAGDASESSSKMAIPSAAGRGRKSRQAPNASSFPAEEDTQERRWSSVGSGRKRKGEDLDSSQSADKTNTPLKKTKEMPQQTPGQTRKQEASPAFRRKSMEPKPKVMFTGVVDDKGQKIVKDLGGELVNSIHDCTHLVTDKIRRTVKFLGGLARGMPVVTPSLLENCKRAGKFLDASKFLVSDSAAEKQYKFSLQNSIHKAAEAPMLEGFKIHVTKSVRPDPGQMKDILLCAGAQYLNTVPKKPDENTFVMSCEEDKTACQPALSVGIPVVSAEFVLTGILRQEVDVNGNRLFYTESKRKQTAGEGGARSKSRKR